MVVPAQEREAEKKRAELEDAKKALEAKKAEEQQKERELKEITDQIKGVHHSPHQRPHQPWLGRVFDLHIMT